MAAVITLPSPSESMKIAPYTLVVSGRDSTTADEVTRWEWDFGDDSSQDPTTERDMVAAHRYENPGTYTVSLTVYDRQGDPVSTTTTSVTVTAFSGTTYYVNSVSGSDVNNGLTPATAWRTLGWAFANSVQSQDNPSKILLAQGSVWVQLADLVMPSPCIIDSYSSGPAAATPEIRFSGISTGLTQQPQSVFGYGVTISNIKILHIGVSNTGDRLIAPRAPGFVLRDTRIENGEITATATTGVKLVIEDCIISGSGRHGIDAAWSFGAVRRTSFLGCGNDYDAHHMLRTVRSGAGLSHWVVDQCTFDGGVAKQGYAAQFRTINGWVLRRSTITNCRFGVAAASYDLPSVGTDTVPSDNGRIVGNVFTQLGKTYSGDVVGAHAIVLGWARNIFVLNNVFYGFTQISNARGCIAVFSTKQGGFPAVDENFIVFSNTFAYLYMATFYFSGETFFSFLASMNLSAIVTSYTPTGHVYCPQNWASDITNHAFFEFNYYWFGVNETFPMFSLDSTSLNTNGSTWRNAKEADAEFNFDPLFVNEVGHDYHLQSGSHARDRGGSYLRLYASPDFDGITRPENGEFDAGAFEYRLAVQGEVSVSAGGLVFADAISLPQPFSTRPIAGSLSLVVGELLIDTELRIPVRVESLNGNLVRLRDLSFPDAPGDAFDYLIYPQMRAALLSGRFERLERIVL